MKIDDVSIFKPELLSVLTQT